MIKRLAGQPHPVLLWGLVLVMTLLWTLNPLAGKIALRHVPPFLLVAVRTALAGVAIPGEMQGMSLAPLLPDPEAPGREQRNRRCVTGGRRQ